MIFQNERHLWQDEQDALSIQLEHRSRDEINDILDDYNKILVINKDLSIGSMGRLLRIIMLLSIPFLIILMGVKWVITGDKYLESWFKKTKLDNFAKKYLP